MSSKLLGRPDAHRSLAVVLVAHQCTLAVLTRPVWALMSLFFVVYVIFIALGRVGLALHRRPGGLW